MNNVLGEALQKALNEKTLNTKNDYSNFIWKGEKIKKGDKYIQNSEKIIDMTPERLKECYKHCERMLYSNDPKNLGRYNVLEEVTEQINKCNIELFLRHCENSYLRKEGFTATPRFKVMLGLRQFMRDSEKDAEEKGITLDWKNLSLTHVASNLPAEFTDISIADALEGCIDKLEAFNKQHLTMTFITSMGLWFTKGEENELKSGGNSNADRLKLAKERLHLPSELILRFSEKGLSFHEMRAILILPKKQKYSDMTTEQLVTLRNKVLPRLLREIDSHIFSWKRLMRQIETIARVKNIDLND
jgi:hypothetical protein